MNRRTVYFLCFLILLTAECLIGAFDWKDLLCYAAGCGLFALTECRFLRKKNKPAD